MKAIARVAALLILAFGTLPVSALAAAHVGDNQPAPRDVAYPGPLKIHVDATNVRQRIMSVQETIPVTPGASMYLLYPAWLPGGHGPFGPINKMAGLTIRGNGTVIPWKRDEYNVYAFQVEVPPGVSNLEVEFQLLTGQSMREWPVRMTPEMLGLSWNEVSLYPAGYYTRRIQAVASVTLPAGWQFGSALEVASTDENTFTFKPIDYQNLVDSPIYAGKYFKRVDLGSNSSPPVHLNLVADAAGDLVLTPEHLQALRNMVVQMDHVYGAFHFDHYDFLFSLSDRMSGTGLEHHRSSEIGQGADYYRTFALTGNNDYMTHEFNHSWNGKYRLPADSATPDFNVPLGNSLLWVYEGQTQFYGSVIAVRAGLEDRATGFARLAQTAATYDMDRPGLQTWRNLEDTTNDPIITQHRPQPFVSYQGNQDYYGGGELIWLAVDGKMRHLSNGRHSLDDFARAFFGMQPGAWDVNPYTFEDIVSALDGIVPFDWKSFLRERLDGHRNLADDLELEGWKLIYAPEPDAGLKGVLNGSSGDFTYSAGFDAAADGRLKAVRWNGPAFKAGLATGMKIVAVGKQKYSPEAMAQAITAAAGSTAAIELKVTNFDEPLTLHLDYHEGLKYPTLVRIGDQPDYLSRLYAPRN